MGNLLSKNGANTLQDLVNRRDTPEVQLTEDNIRVLLALVAQRLYADSKNITIVAVGGAVNTVLLRSRSSTGDVDFFYNTKLKNEDVSSVVNAAVAVAKRNGLESSWLNNHTAVFMDQGYIHQLYDEAKAQNEIIFQAPGLTVLAAPWRYAISMKLDRLMKTGAKPYDLDDAVAYIKRYISGTSGGPVRSRIFGDWANEFKCTPPSSALVTSLANRYAQLHRAAGILP